MAAKRPKRHFGSIRKLPSGRFQARHTGPDGLTHSARTREGKPLTFDTRGDAEGWLSLRHSEILRGAWLPAPAKPAAAASTFAQYADDWLARRDLAERTRDHYARLLRDHINPTFGQMAITAITPAAVRAWHARLARAHGRGKAKKPDRPTVRAHAYSLLRTILNTAVADDLVTANPCRVRSAGQAKRAVRIKPATLAELEAIVSAMPDRHKLLVLLASWCGLRYGELAELRRRDIDVINAVVHVRRAVVRTDHGRVVKGPKSVAGMRTVAIPPHLTPLVKQHLRDHALAGREALLFASARDPRRHLAPSTMARVFYPAREAAGRPDLRFHDLRHTGATLAAATGATLAELMSRLGHSTVGAALRYQHAAQDSDKAIAAGLSKLAAGQEIKIREERK